MSFTFEELREAHPCFATGAKPNKGRIHLPVSPGCNIACHFCERKINDIDMRPGVASTIITPVEAVEIVRRAVAICPDITVVGVAGPGDTLATPYALETFRLIKAEFPHIITCMSTNGLLLPDYAQESIDVGIDTLTVTINAISADVLKEICGGIVYHGKHYQGEAAAEILIQNQLNGIKYVADRGITVKVNSVLIPEINAEYIGDIAKAVSAAGAQIYNIIPLIPQHELSWCSAPDCELIRSTREEAEQYIKVFRHCQRCRADAIGIPGGKDFGKDIYKRPLKQENTFSHG